MKRTQILLSLLIIGYLLLVISPAALANVGVALPNPLGRLSIAEVIGNMIQVFMGAAGAIALMFFIYGGFLWLTSAGNPETIKKGKDILLWAVLGMALMFGSYIIVKYIMVALTTGTALLK